MIKIFTLLLLTTISTQASAANQILKCSKTEKAGRVLFEKTYSQKIEDGNAFIQKISELDETITFIGYVSKDFKNIGAHINDQSNSSSSGSYADYTLEKPVAKVNYKRMVKNTAQGLFVFECEITK